VLTRLLERIARNRAVSLTAAFGLFAAALFSLPFLKLNDAPERWLPSSSVEAWSRFDRHFTRGDNIGIAIHFQRPVRDSDLAYLKQLRRELREIDGVISVIDMSVIAEVEQQPLTEILRDPEDRTRDPYASYRGVLFDDPEYWNPDADPSDPQERTLIAYVELDTGAGSGDASGANRDEQERRREIVRQMNAILEEAERDDVTFHVIGAIVIQSELERIARRVILVFLPLSLLLTFLALGVGFRSFSAVLLATLAAAWSITVLMGLVVWVGWSLNVVTVGAPTLMFVIVIAAVVHFAHYEADRPVKHDRDGKPLLNEGPSTTTDRHFIRWVGIPCLGAAVTTGMGFLMLAFNELAPTRELGVELCVGSILAFFGTFLMRLIVPIHKPPHAGRWLRGDRLRRLHELVTARPRSVIAAMLVLTAGLGIGATQIRIDADPFSFFHPESKMARAFRHIEERRFGMYMLDVVLLPKNRPDDPQQRSIEAMKDRRAARRFQRTIAQRDEVRNVVSTMDMRRRLEQLEIALRLANDPEEAERLRESIKRFREVFRNWLVDKAGDGAMRISFKVDNTGEGFRPLIAEVREEFPEDRFDYFYSGTAADSGALAEGLLGGMLRGLMTALVLMAIVCGLWFRSLRLTLIAFFPNVFPVLFVLGVMGLFGVPLNSGSVMVTTIALGVALNDTVHFVMHYRERRLEGESPDRALSDTFAEIGRPIVMTSIVACLGFSIFLLTDFQPMADFVLLTGVAMLAALFGDLFLLPSLLKVFDRSSVPGNENRAGEQTVEANAAPL